MKHLYILFISIFAIMALADDVDDRIVGGASLSIISRKFQVSIEFLDGYEENPFCGGVLIKPCWILTAAHCTNNHTESQIKVRAGSDMTDMGGVTRGVEKIYQHDDFKKKRRTYDISLLKLIKEFPTGKRIELIKLRRKMPEPGTKIIVSGFGKTAYNASKSENLMTVTVTLLDWDVCVASYGNRLLNGTQFCAGDLGKDACGGDSGGPVTYKKKLVGIVSYGIQCALEKYPGIYTSVPFFFPWIKETIANHEEQLKNEE